MITIKLKDYTVELNDNLTYGMNEEIKASTLGAMTITADMRKQINGDSKSEVKMNGEALLASK